MHSDAQRAAGSLKLYAGQPAGCEGAVQAVTAIFTEPGTCTQVILLADAINALNCLN